MLCVEALEQLRHHQDAILAHVDRATDFALLDPVYARGPLAKARWEMARMLRAYQLFKHTEIFDPAIACGLPHQRQAAQAMKEDCLAAGEAYWAHTRRWSSEDIACRWEDYRPAMLAMAGQIRSHVTRERANLALLLTGSTRTRRLRA